MGGRNNTSQYLTSLYPALIYLKVSAICLWSIVIPLQCSSLFWKLSKQIWKQEAPLNKAQIYMAVTNAQPSRVLPSWESMCCPMICAWNYNCYTFSRAPPVFLTTELYYKTTVQKKKKKSLLSTNFSHSQIIAWSLKSPHQPTWQI